jgi:hypothetical protein
MRAAQSKRAMRCRHNEPATDEMGLHKLCQPAPPRGVERAGRLVKEPDRPFDGEQAGD